MGSTSYTKSEINNVKKLLADYNLRFNKKLYDPLYTPMNPFWTQYYRSELDVSNECDDFLTTYFQNLIGILRWIVKLGRIDIAFEVSTLSKHLAFPRTGYIYQALHIFKYLEVHINNRLAFDPLFRELSQNEQTRTKIEEMEKVYKYLTEELPTNAPVSLGTSIQVKYFLDSDHDGN